MIKNKKRKSKFVDMDFRTISEGDILSMNYGFPPLNMIMRVFRSGGRFKCESRHTSHRLINLSEVDFQSTSVIGQMDRNPEAFTEAKKGGGYAK